MDLKNKFLIFYLLIVQLIYCNIPSVLPDYNNIIFKQLKADISENNRRIINNLELLPVQFYLYKVKDGDSIFSVAARFNLPYDTIASLNNIDNQLFFTDINEVLLPNCEGIYSKHEIDEDPLKIEFENKIVYFYPGKRFTNKQRTMFLITPFISPLHKMIVTSEFGYRESPFSGKREFHSGLDLKANINTELFSPYDGVIKDIHISKSFGLVLVIDHKNAYSSVYYHLSRTIVHIGEQVKKGEQVGYTGNSGKTTGPHLHMEIHHNGVPVNPRILLGNV